MQRVAGLFHRSRGLALGFVRMGIGISAATVPPLVSWMIANWGCERVILLSPNALWPDARPRCTINCILWAVGCLAVALEGSALAPAR